MKTLLKGKNFRSFLFGGGISEVGNWINFIAITVLVYDLTGSGLAVGGIFIAKVIPSLVLAPLAGILVDRWDRKRVMIFAVLGHGLLVLTIPLILHFNLGSSVHLSYLYFVSATSSAILVFSRLARMALLPTLVSSSLLTPANASLEMVSDALAILGPGLGGGIVGFLGAGNAFVLSAFTFFASARAIHLISPLISLRQESPQSMNMWADLLEAYRFLRKQSTVSLLIVITTIVMMGGGAVNALFIVYARRTLGIDPVGFGFLLSSLGIGFLIGSSLMGLVGARFRQDRAFTLGVLIVALAPLSWAKTRTLPVAMVIGVANGIGNNVFGIAQQTLLQRLVPDKLRGKVFSLDEFLPSISSLISIGVGGWAADQIGVNTVFIFASLFGLIAFTLAAWLSFSKGRHVG